MFKLYLGCAIPFGERKPYVDLSDPSRTAAYGLIRSWVSPSKPSEKTCTNLVKVVSNCHNPKPSAIMQRFKFNCCIRGTNESIAENVTSLRQLAEYCEYGTFLVDMLRNRIVRGINDAQIQRR